ncbi:MAG TPA: TPM domain-containing protein [Candidatus Omnitrophota bacterium]|nr:TPM domain-containing protein [Candidatus Omnitrophota bacterium]
MRRICFTLIAVGLFASSLWAEFQIPEKPDGYVTDHAGLLSPQIRVQIESVLSQYEKETSNQIVLAIFPTLGGSSLEDVSIRIAEKWKIGQKDRDNGVLFVVFRDDRQMRIEVGYGLEGVLTDLLSSQIIRNDVVPHFRAGDYERGIYEGVRAIIDAARGEYQPMTTAVPENNGAAFYIFFIIAGIIFGVDLIRYGFYAQTHSSAKRYGFWEWFFLFAVFWFILRIVIESSLRSGGRGWSSGGGSSGGGFSGGGGSFGGGGASGRW